MLFIQFRIVNVLFVKKKSFQNSHLAVLLLGFYDKILKKKAFKDTFLILKETGYAFNFFRGGIFQLYLIIFEKMKMKLKLLIYESELNQLKILQHNKF